MFWKRKIVIFSKHAKSTQKKVIQRNAFYFPPPHQKKKKKNPKSLCFLAEIYFSLSVLLKLANPLGYYYFFFGRLFKGNCQIKL